MNDKLSSFSPVQVEKPVDLIIAQIRQLITDGVLNPGDKLPPERELAGKLGLGRGHVREAIKRLEMYGILKTVAQSGTYVAKLGVVALQGLIANVLQLHKNDLVDLIETRALLEIEAAARATAHITDAQLEALQELHQAFSLQVQKGNSGIEEDLLFHLKIAEGSKNSVLLSLISIITPDMIEKTLQQNICSKSRTKEVLQEHQAILLAIQQRQPQAAKKAMQLHMQNIIQLFKENINEK